MRVGKRITAVLQAIISAVILSGFMLPAASAQNVLPEAVFIAPLLPSGVAEYNEAYPEALLPDQLYAKSAILIEAKSGTVVFEKNADQIMYPASTTKILTVFLGIVLGDLNATAMASTVTVNMPEGSSSIPLTVGETINFKDLLYATFVRSGNDGANLIAETLVGSVSAFAEVMNQAAAKIGCTQTHFSNPSGLDDLDNYTTARDMAKIAQEAMKNDLFRDIAKTYTYSLPRSNMQGSRVLIGTDTNWLNQADDNAYYYPYAIGIKTGFLNRAGYCYVGAAERNGVELISVVFYSTRDGRWTDSKKLMEFGYTQFVSVTPMELYAMNPTEISTSGYSLQDTNLGRLELGIRSRAETTPVMIVATKAEVEEMARNLRENVLIEFTRENNATPITAGEIFGTLTYYPSNGSEPAVYDLYATRSIERRENAPKTIAEIEAETYADSNPFPPFSLETVFLIGWPIFLLIGIVLILVKLLRKKNKRGKKQYIPKPKTRYFR